jgi:membrane-bound lytic murein transglycosylase A
MAAALLALSACAPRALVGPPAGIPPGVKPAAGPLVKIPHDEYPDLTDASEPFSLAASAGYSADYYRKLPAEKKIGFGDESFTAVEMAASMSDLQEFLRSGPSPALLEQYINANFELYSSIKNSGGGQGGVLFTGYFLPELAASPVSDERFAYPVYGAPPELGVADLGLFSDKLKGQTLTGLFKDGRFVPCWTRREIEDGALAGRNLELAWCDDPAGIFFMQVQGSGILRFADGTSRNINYAAQSGRAYRSIGKYLIEKGKASPDEMSLDFLKKYLKDHPGEAADILNYNESYVFFRLEDSGPFGCLGVPVTGGRSIATDRSVYPPGALAFISTEIPRPTGTSSDTAGGPSWEPYSRFVVNQDTGGAIRGPGRVDIYFGPGEEARYRAGYMKRMGRLYFLAPKKSGN